MAQLEDVVQAQRLEHYRSRQEAARGFDDDLEFCPSLSVEELAEFRRKASLRVMKPNVTPPQPKRAIPIIDPANKTPLNISPIKSNNTPNSSSSNASVSISSPFFSRPGSPFSYGSFSPNLPYQTLTSSAGLMTPTKGTKSIPIVDPSSGNIVNMPANGPSSSISSDGNNAPRFQGYFSDISVRSPTSLAFQALAAPVGLMTPTKVTKSIPIVDPNSGNIVNMPANGSSSSNSSDGNNAPFSGFFDISVRNAPIDSFGPQPPQLSVER
ncbi:hypothetical protein G9A89_023739 [Geosiphon pyriformis]|nr:hypothetical protein G9A89_023739 [Geosiphon pyriformis]